MIPNRIREDLKTKDMIISAVLSSGFVALWWFARVKPKLCLALGLALFWGIQIYSASHDSKWLTRGIVVKVLFTVALVRGLKSADRAEDLRAQLGEVFE
jgi:hypothetical protein